jgi:RNA polymerase sigma-70 factor (ECF subfamily)
MDETGKDRDLELIGEFKAGRKEVFDQLMELHASKLFQTAYGLLGNRQDAEEVVQDAFVRAHKALAEFRGESSFETWMHRIVVNLSRNKYHWNRRRGEGLHTSLSERSSLNSLNESSATTQDIPLPDSTYEPDKLMESNEFEGNVMLGLEKLPDTLREAMVLRHVKDLPYERIAELLECKIGTVKSRLARGREALRDFLGKLDPGLKPAVQAQAPKSN